MKYQVVAENIGVIIDTDDWKIASHVYNVYVTASADKVGNVSNKPIKLLSGGIIAKEFIPN
ncbi:MAG: hypothetical protein DRJ01_07030 [Bacteroidetes bacterium]|nr:MAG: hypothetical protein DRJ01_07030 [Bacteroidota bacterium]